MEDSIVVKRLHCQRCGADWMQSIELARVGRLPTACAICKSRYWETPSSRVKKVEEEPAL